MQQPRLQQAISDWRQLLGDDAVIDQSQTLLELSANCTGLGRVISALIRATQADQVAAIVKIAAHHGVALHPFSTGNNWGYGSKNPPCDHTVLLDLSQMNRIIDFDPASGLLSIEPGVTQGQLADFLAQHDYQFLVPVTGAGPNCSLLANALERGFGITPYADHFGALTALEAVLPNGEVYRSMLKQMGGEHLDQAFKWGVGPYLDGLFSQSNFGIVTRITIVLAAKPERVEAFFFSIKQADDLERVASAVQQLLRRLGPVLGAINLMNKHRVLSMSEPYPQDQLGADGLIPESVLARLMQRNQLTEWTGIGAIYGSNKIAAAARWEIRRSLGPLVDRLVFLTPSLIGRLHGIAGGLPWIRNSNLLKILSRMHQTLQIFAGVPNEVALPLAYWRSGRPPVTGVALNPDRDQCGLIWYAPLLVMQPQNCQLFVEMVSQICRKHRIEPLITLTSLSDRCWNSTIPILFDRNDEQDCERAYRCHEELMERGRQQGYIPYRLGSHSLDFPARHQATPELWKILKQAIDPKGILSPGRYEL